MLYLKNVLIVLAAIVAMFIGIDVIFVEGSGPLATLKAVSAFLMSNEVFSLFGVCLFLCVYFLPSIIAFRRDHHNDIPIVLMNIFLGWTFIGWVVALIWSASHVIREA